MMIKRGINNTRVTKRIPGYPKEETPDKVAGPSGSYSRRVTCASCGAKFEKTCPTEAACEMNATCPKCGGVLS